MKGNEVGETKFKVCLVGEGAVGKTSLVRRFVLGEYDDRYLYTLGTNVYKKEVRLPSESGRKSRVTMMIWDIVGQKDLRHLFTKSYFRGAEGGIAVCDVTREHTLNDLTEWIENMHEVCGQLPIVVLANKVDLEDRIEVGEDRLLEFTSKYSCPCFFTSAKTGENVEAAFLRLAREVVNRNATSKQAP
jgi:small GTP-binding protein